MSDDDKPRDDDKPLILLWDTETGDVAMYEAHVTPERLGELLVELQAHDMIAGSRG